MCDFKEALESPPAPWGTSPVGSPLRKDEGAPLRYGGLWGNSNSSLKSPAEMLLVSSIS